MSDLDALRPGLRATVTHVVGPDDTAEALGSGDVPVLGTPRVVALAEAATVQAVTAVLPPGRTTLGTRVEVEHLAPSPVGQEVQAVAELTVVDGRTLRFGVTVHGDGELLAHGTVDRVLVDRERFLVGLPTARA